MPISIYIFVQCIRRAECKYPLPSSQKIPAKTKFMYGAGGLVTLFTIIWFPLVLFALGNTVGEPNIPTDMYAKVQISSYQSIYDTYTSKVYRYLRTFLIIRNSIGICDLLQAALVSMDDSRMTSDNKYSCHKNSLGALIASVKLPLHD